MYDQSRFEKFIALREAIKEQLNWRSAGPLRDAAALAALGLDGSPAQIARSLQEPADTLKQNHNKLALLKNHGRYAIAAILLQSGTDPATFTRQLETSRQRWKEIGLRRGAPHEGAALLMLHLGREGSTEVPFLTSLNLAFDDLNKRRYWHVGTRTVPPLALALQYRSDAASAADEMYGAMKEVKGYHGRQTMEAALMAILSDGYAPDIARRIADMRLALKDRKIPDAPANITGLAFANLTDPDPAQFADTVKALREAFKNHKFGSTNRALLALDYVTAERFKSSDLPLAKIAPLMMAVHAYQVVLQQQAAAAAAASSAVIVAGAS